MYFMFYYYIFILLDVLVWNKDYTIQLLPSFLTTFTCLSLCTKGGRSYLLNWKSRCQLSIYLLDSGLYITLFLVYIYTDQVMMITDNKSAINVQKLIKCNMFWMVHAFKLMQISAILLVKHLHLITSSMLSNQKQALLIRVQSRHHSFVCEIRQVSSSVVILHTMYQSTCWFSIVIDVFALLGDAM